MIEIENIELSFLSLDDYQELKDYMSSETIIEEILSIIPEEISIGVLEEIKEVIA